MVRVAIRGCYTPKDGEAIFSLLERYSEHPEPPSKFYFDLGDMTEFGLGYLDVVQQAKRAMQLRFTRRLVFGIYTTSPVTRGFATVFGKFVDKLKLRVVVSDDREIVERELRF
ncbi:MAG TPA: hypothetical protein VFQ61_30730 [Polyangiaceae bacterium]|nr:hypothetical protein [Polyangiaceae bacterium]